MTFIWDCLSPPLSLSPRSLFQDLQTSPFNSIYFHLLMQGLGHLFLGGHQVINCECDHLKLYCVLPTSWSAGGVTSPAAEEEKYGENQV